MLFMINKLKSYITFCLLIVGQIVLSQSNNLSSSPYSIYGLGNSNEVNTGKTNALGKTGIAMPSNTSINNLNPASFSTIPEKSFLFDIGIKAENETLFEDGKKETKYTANFSNIAIAFPITKNSGFGATLIPFTNVGYEVLDIESEIDGSTDTFLSNITGSGGLNNLNLNYGYAIDKKLRLGISGSVLFGNIDEEEIIYFENNNIIITEQNHYSGFQFGAGFQYDWSNSFSFGSTVSFPTELKGDQTKIFFEDGYTPIESNSGIDTFKLPLEIGLGIHTKINESLFFNLDYKRSFWDATKQSDSLGNYVDQDFIGIGTEFIPNKNSFSYWKKINYRAGFNIDNGSLAIKDNRVSNYALNIGVGIPISPTHQSMLNIGYSYGQKGQVSNGLIKENYHTLTFNISLEGKWFQKRYID